MHTAHQRSAETSADLLHRGRRTGAIRRDLDPRAAAWWLLSLLHARTFRAALMPDQAELEAQLVALTLDTPTSR